MRTKNVKLWNHINANLKDFEIRAGWFENSLYDDNTPIAGIAAIQNYGAHIKAAEKFKNYLHAIGIHLKKDKGEFIIPPRPFMDNARKRVEGQEGKEMLMQEVLRVFEGRQTMEQAAKRLGLWCQGVIQEELRKIETPELSEATIKLRNAKYVSKSKRKSTKPLVATGLMLETVQSKVTMK